MKSIDRAFKDQFFLLLQKSSVFTQREVFALWAIIATIVDTRSFSLSEVSRRFGRRVGRNFLGKVLKKYAYVQRTIVKLIIQTICAELSQSAKIYLITDDMIVQKRGKKMLGVVSWYDHTRGRSVRAWCLVNVALVVDNQVLFVLPWLLTRPSQSGKTKRKKAVEQDIKTQVALDMFGRLIHWLNEGGVSSKRIVVLAGNKAVGTKACVLALTSFWKKTLQGYRDGETFTAVIQGFDLDGDGKVDSIEVME